MIRGGCDAARLDSGGGGRPMLHGVRRATCSELSGPGTVSLETVLIADSLCERGVACVDEHEEIGCAPGVESAEANQVLVVPAPSVLIPQKGRRACDAGVGDSPGGALSNNVGRVKQLTSLAPGWSLGSAILRTVAASTERASARKAAWLSIAAPIASSSCDIQVLLVSAASSRTTVCPVNASGFLRPRFDPHRDASWRGHVNSCVNEIRRQGFL